MEPDVAVMRDPIVNLLLTHVQLHPAPYCQRWARVLMEYAGNGPRALKFFFKVSMVFYAFNFVVAS